ncbi:MAG: protein kinase [Verrucomicrobia bacterium]|nr:protein kinase [Verrucomicrobiota bacterium]
MSKEGKRVCDVCGTVLNGFSRCPVCELDDGLNQEDTIHQFSVEGAPLISPLRLQHYEVLKHEDGTLFKLGSGAMGVTYKALDVNLRCPVALKVINARFLGDQSTRRRFIREARAAASVRHPNVASVFHLGPSGDSYFYAMEFVEGESLDKVIRRAGPLTPATALKVTSLIVDGLAAIDEQHLVHRDIKPGNIMVKFQRDTILNAKIIDLGLAKSVIEDGSMSEISGHGAFAGTPRYASPEQFSGIGVDIRSDLYSLGVTLWEMLSNSAPFEGSAAELMGQHQHSEPPFAKLKGVPKPVVSLLEVLLQKDPGGRFKDPAQLQLAITKVKEALDAGVELTPDELRSAGDKVADASPKKSSLPLLSAIGYWLFARRWLVPAALVVAGLLVAWFLMFDRGRSVPNNGGGEPGEKSIAVLPFDSFSENRSDIYFADGVQDEILNNLAKIAQLKVISRTSVMQYRSDSKRDLRQIANTLGVANVLEGTVRRDGNRVRVSTELIDGRNDRTVWADSYDRNLSDIFEIQSEIARIIAAKLAATLSPGERQQIDRKPTEDVRAYDLYLRAKEILSAVEANGFIFGGNKDSDLIEATDLLEQAVRVDPKFTLAYCLAAKAQAWIWLNMDETPTRRARAEAAIKTALQLQPGLPEVRLAHAAYLFRVDHNLEGALAEIESIRRDLPNNVEVFELAAKIHRRQGAWQKSTQEFEHALALDPRNTDLIASFIDTYNALREFDRLAELYDRLINALPDDPTIKVDKALAVPYQKYGDKAALWAAIAALPASMANDPVILRHSLCLALDDHDWNRAENLLEQLKPSKEAASFAYTSTRIPVGCFALVLAKLRGKPPGAEFDEARDQLASTVQMAPNDASLLSELAVTDALLSRTQDALREAQMAVEMLPVSKDALDGPRLVINEAVVYAWTGRPDLAFDSLKLSATTPNGIVYGDLKVDPLWDPIRQDPRYQKLLAELAPKD